MTKKAATSKTEDEVDKKLETMTLSPTPTKMKKSSGSASVPFKQYSLGYQWPFKVYTYRKQGAMFAAVKFFVSAMNHKNFLAEITPCGNFLKFKTICPDLMLDEVLIEDENVDVKSFNQDTHEATTYQSITEDMQQNSLDSEKHFAGPPQIVKLPFNCDKKVSDIKNNCFDMYDEEVQADYGTQYHRTITIECVSSANPKQKMATPAGKVRVRRTKVGKSGTKNGGDKDQDMY